MPTNASATNFLPDGRLKLRTSGADALTSTFTSDALDLVLLQPYWNTDEHGLARDILFAINIEDLALEGAESYVFSLEIDSSEAFGSPTTVDSETISAANADSGLFDLALTRETLLLLGPADQFVRLKMVPTGVAETGTVTVGSTAHDGDTVTIDDGVNDAVVFTFGDGTGGTVDKGVSATASAQNLKAAIAAAVLAETLSVTATGASTALALTNTAANTGGAISTSSGGRITVVDWANGLDASVQFWSFVRPGCYSRG